MKDTHFKDSIDCFCQYNLTFFSVNSWNVKVRDFIYFFIWGIFYICEDSLRRAGGVGGKSPLFGRGGDSGSEGLHTNTSRNLEMYNPSPTFFLPPIGKYWFFFSFLNNTSSWADAWRHYLGLPTKVISELNQQQFYSFEPQLSQLMFLFSSRVVGQI